MPHYWFRVPLSNTAKHLKDAKERGGAPEIKKELRKDAHSRSKSLRHASFTPGLSECLAEVESPEPMTDEECDWFNERWDTGMKGCPVPHHDADETIDESGGWRFEPPSRAS